MDYYVKNAAEAIKKATGCVNFQNTIPFDVGEIVPFTLSQLEDGSVECKKDRINTADGREFELFNIIVNIEYDGQKWSGPAGIGCSQKALEEVFNSGAGYAQVIEVGKNKIKALSILKADDSKAKTTIEAEAETKA